MDGAAIPGLYAAGEVTGFGGINGKAGLEGTFLGPSILTGRVSGQSVVSELREWGVIGSDASPRAPAVTDRSGSDRSQEQFDNATCTTCHDLGEQVAQERPGYWHFELSHRSILADGRRCIQCHQELAPFDSERHAVDPLVRAQSCGRCHGLQAID